MTMNIHGFLLRKTPLRMNKDLCHQELECLLLSEFIQPVSKQYSYGLRWTDPYLYA